MEVHLLYPPEQLADLAFVRVKAQQLFEYKELQAFLLDYDKDRPRSDSSRRGMVCPPQDLLL